MRLFLGSDGLGALPAWLPETRRAVVVPTAATPLGSPPFVAAAFAVLRGAGARVEALELADASERDVARALRGARVVFVTGGHAIHLLRHARRSGFDRVVVEAVREGRLDYVGMSAGAALVGPDLEWFRDPGDPGVVGSARGLGLVPFTVLAHRNRGRAERHDRLGGLSIRDDQAVVVDGERWRIIPSPSCCE
ncbi:Type 1 glutamine amidotransferase-like domain-containing protein [Actinomadura kijaniata]|uniref:Type 1 glutamine amidotransferase-like domain-containing protein n=1 Tax=Actinomadura kijaniata TaxID=46161 RepID=UPI000ACEDC81|nr:Type 1 glutamine amidotransferase-like domain-containing protein [Actinomadura kijaniata]